MNTQLSPRLIAIVGGSGAGKTWLTRQLVERFDGQAGAVALDDFYRDRSRVPAARRGALNFDHPRAIDWPCLERFLDDCRLGRPATLPRYNFETHTREPGTRLWQAYPLVFVEGLWLLRRREIRARFDYTIYLDCPARLRLARRRERDVAERARTAAAVERQFCAQVAPMHERFVEPQRRWADLVLQPPIDTTTVRRLAVYLRCWLGHWSLLAAAPRLACRPPGFRTLLTNVNHE